MTATSLLTPWLTSSVVELFRDDGEVVFRKQILPRGEITVDGRRVKLDDDYFQRLISSFEAGACDYVPFQLAPDRNMHTEDPERTRGKVRALQMSGSGLDAIIGVRPETAEMLDQTPELGVSVKVVEPVERVTGESYPAALMHVLGTIDPAVTRMQPWQRVAQLSHSVESEFDLTDRHFDHGGSAVTAPNNPNPDQTITVELTRTQQAQLLELLADNQAAVELAHLMEGEQGDQTPPPNPDDPAPRSGDQAAPAPTPGGSGSTPTPGVQAGDDRIVELIRTLGQGGQSAQITQLTHQLATQAQELADLRSNQARDSVEVELEQIRHTGLAPAVIEAARPLLEVQQVTELTRVDGSRVDATRVVRDVLWQVLELSRNGQLVVDLDHEVGTYSNMSPEQTREKALIDAWETDYPTQPAT